MPNETERLLRGTIIMPNDAAQIVEEVEVLEKTAPGGYWQEVLGEFLKPETVAGKAGSIILILLVAAAVYWLLMVGFARARRRLEQAAVAATGPARTRQHRAATAVSLIANIARWAIVLLTGIWVLGALGVDLLPVLTGVGFLGVAVAFGAQTLVRDFVSGLFLLLEGQYAVGDYVNLSGHFGLVEQIGLRVTVLRDLDNQLHHIPNGTITAVTVYEEPYVNYVAEVPLATPEDANKVRGALEELSAELRAEYPLHITGIEPPRVDRDQRGITLVRLPLTVFPTQDWIATEHLVARIQLLLAELEVQIPTGLKVRVYPDIRQLTGAAETEDLA